MSSTEEVLPVVEQIEAKGVQQIVNGNSVTKANKKSEYSQICLF